MGCLWGVFGGAVGGLKGSSGRLGRQDRTWSQNHSIAPTIFGDFGEVFGVFVETVPEDVLGVRFCVSAGGFRWLCL